MSIGRGCSQLVFHKQSFEVSYWDAIISVIGADVLRRLYSNSCTAHARVYQIWPLFEP